ncbi:ATP-dependent RecD-like DNA helicase [Flavobacteriaceae bacterium]|nr:ATP-dependent RecD-like DNA helicase [Flavobacteriaceae bacterium]
MKLVFRILKRELPLDFSEWVDSSNKWGRWKVKVESCSNPNYKVGTTVIFQGSMLESCAPYFQYNAFVRVLKRKHNRLAVVSPMSKESVVNATRDKSVKKFTITEKEFLVQEVLLNGGDREKLRKTVQKYNTIKAFADNPIFFNACDYFRLEIQTIVNQYFPKQHKQIRTMEIGLLTKCVKLIKTEPWMLMFEKYDTLREMTLQCCNEARYKYSSNTTPIIRTAMRLYNFIRKQQSDVGHTMFLQGRVTELFLLRTTANNHIGDKENMDEAYWYLEHRSLKYVDQYIGLFCLLKDESIAIRICKNIENIQENAKDASPEQRENPIVKLSYELTGEQVDAITHISTNWLTIVLGGPGHGKSATIVWAINAFKKVLVVTFVGKAVDVLKTRTNNYEHIHTIHFVYFKSLYSKEWISQFDIVIVDEMSNVDDGLFNNLLKSISHICRLLLVGDLAQINPIAAGNPFRDLVKCFGDHTFHLTVNLRVNEKSKLLANTSIRIRDNKINEIDFSESECLNRIDREKDMGMTLEPILRQNCKNIADFQLICLRNQERNRINTLVENWLVRKGINKVPQNSRSIRRNFALYVGKKIMFTKNNTVVRNGEIGIISKIVTCGSKITLTLANSNKVVKIGDGVDCTNPNNIDLGYAITCNKSQGSEWDNVLFWIQEDLSDFWTREYMYVAESRAKLSCTIVGTEAEIRKLCRNKARPRQTILSWFLNSQ